MARLIGQLQFLREIIIVLLRHIIEDWCLRPVEVERAVAFEFAEACDRAKLQPVGKVVGHFRAKTELLVLRDRSEVTRSEEHTSELQSLMRISYAVFCLKKKKYKRHINDMEIYRK